MSMSREDTQDNAEKPQNATIAEKQSIEEDETYYDFQSFLTLMKNPNAEPIVKYTKSFIHNFVTQRDCWNTVEQVKLINDFKIFIYDKLASNDVFKDLDKPQIRNSKEGIEKLVMGKLYPKCFSPCLAEYHVSTDPTHAADLVKDAQLSEKTLEFRFLSPQHLEILPALINAKLDNFVLLSGKELRKINNYKSPRDKMVCVLNCCKVLFGILKHSKAAHGGADDFVPLLIYTLLKSNVKNLVSNVNYIERFRYPPFLQGEGAYYLSTLQGAINFILDMDKDSLSITETDQEFDKKYQDNKAVLGQPAAAKPLDSGKDTRQLSPSPSEFILKPLDDAASSIISKLNEFWSSTASPTPQSSTPDDSHEDRHEIDEHTATVLAHQMEQKEHENTLNTLQMMFPDLDPELIQDVCGAGRYRVGVCVDALLDMAG